VTVALTVSGLMHPAHHHVSVATLEPTKLAVSGIGAALAVAVLGYVGFETAAVLTEEAKNSRRTIATATYLSLGCIAVVYAGASWAMAVHYGDSNVVSVAGQQGPAMMFALGNAFLSNAGQTLYLTSLFAAMLAFHSFVTRYMFALGREGVLPRMLGITSRQGSPKVASGLQSTLGLGVILVYALAHWDPLVKLFFWLGTTGGFGILVLVALTSVAVIAYFARHPGLESLWHRVVAPTVASLALFAVVWLVITNYATLLGVRPGSAAAHWLPAIFALAGAIGVLWALVLRAGNPAVYQTIGLGADAATGHINPLAKPDPVPRDVEV
jgi:amino acid transporter